MAVTCLIVHPYSFVRLGVSTSCTLTRHCWLAPAPALDFGSAGESRRVLGQRPQHLGDALGQHIRKIAWDCVPDLRVGCVDAPV